jgi:uncharacterized repeat protein (TIGR03803 family)
MSKFTWVMKACGVFLLWATAAVSLPAQTFTSLVTFGRTGGDTPEARLIQATNGEFYGTTQYGGANHFGTVFEITPDGTLTTVYSFCSLFGCTDGELPRAGLIQGADGDFYGTTQYGGAFDGGTVFKITQSGTLTTLHTFGSTDGDGTTPAGGLVQGIDGDFHGTTQSGGAYEDGTVFKITPSGMLTILHSFAGPDGYWPEAGLVQAINGDFYGTTYYGGANVCEGLGCGTVFKITPSGTLTTLHSFDQTDGAYPQAALLQATNGEFYGTTGYGGAYAYYGTVFQITPIGILTTLHSFNQTDGSYPEAGLFQATNGDFYGTTYEGGASGYCMAGYGCGTIFQITQSGTLTTIYNFCSLTGCTDGDYPLGGLTQDTNGTLYGTTAKGGSTGAGCPTGDCGTAFSLSVGLKPFVETQPTLGTAGTAVNILGSNLSGATSVTFNGTAATFTVVSKTLITTTVPAGATTGVVEVVRPNGKGLSNIPFTVLP